MSGLRLPDSGPDFRSMLLGSGGRASLSGVATAGTWRWHGRVTNM